MGPRKLVCLIRTPAFCECAIGFRWMPGLLGMVDSSPCEATTKNRLAASTAGSCADGGVVGGGDASSHGQHWSGYLLFTNRRVSAIAFYFLISSLLFFLFLRGWCAWLAAPLLSFFVLFSFALPPALRVGVGGSDRFIRGSLSHFSRSVARSRRFASCCCQIFFFSLLSLRSCECPTKCQWWRSLWKIVLSEFFLALILWKTKQKVPTLFGISKNFVSENSETNQVCLKSSPL